MNKSSRWGRELVALLCLSSWCLVIVVWLFLAMPWGCLQFVIVVFPDHTHLLFMTCMEKVKKNVTNKNRNKNRKDYVHAL